MIARYNAILDAFSKVLNKTQIVVEFSRNEFPPTINDVGRIVKKTITQEFAATIEPIGNSNMSFVHR